LATDAGVDGAGRATVLLPRSLLALFPGVDRRHEVAPGTVATALEELERTVPGLRDRLIQEGPRLRPHINVFVDGEPGGLDTPVTSGSTVHVIPAVSGGAVIS
jgi:molybdopterin converting factor small subunit